jgi:FMN reductase (NADPH)
MGGMNGLLTTMSAHRSVRAFLETPVPDEHIRSAVEAARMAATSSWIQAGAFFVVCADSRRHRLIAERLDKPYVGNLETWLPAVIDASLFVQNLNLAFESMGYGTCFIGGLRNRLPEVDALLQLPHGVVRQRCLNHSAYFF